MSIFPPTIPGENGFPPGTSDATKFAYAVLNDAWTTAKTATNAFDDIVTGAVARNDYFANANNLVVGTANETPVAEPVVDIPSSVTPGEVMTLFDQKYLELVALLVEKFATFQSTYFPNDAATYAQAESWITGAMSNPDQAIPAAVAAQMLTDVKTRVYAEASVANDTVLATFATRGYPLPPGSAASAVLQITQKAQNEVAESGRKLMIEYVSQMKFAVEHALMMRKDAMGAAISYINALASGPSMASGLINNAYDAQSKLISSAASFYNARTGASQLLKQAEQFNVDRKYTKDERNVSNDMVVLQENIKILVTEAQALAQIATALFNNANVSASVSV